MGASTPKDHRNSDNSLDLLFSPETSDDEDDSAYHPSHQPSRPSLASVEAPASSSSRPQKETLRPSRSAAGSAFFEATASPGVPQAAIPSPPAPKAEKLNGASSKLPRGEFWRLKGHVADIEGTKIALDLWNERAKSGRAPKSAAAPKTVVDARVAAARKSVANPNATEATNATAGHASPEDPTAVVDESRAARALDVAESALPLPQTFMPPTGSYQKPIKRSQSFIESLFAKKPRRIPAYEREDDSEYCP
jgi:hypothetical protein